MAEVDVRGLERALNRISGEVGRLGNKISGVDEKVVDVQRVQATTQDRLTSLQNELRDFVAEARRADARQHAATRIVEVKTDLENTYGHYNVVRRTATGILQAFDRGLVSEESVRRVVEDQTLQTPGYWLAPALVGLARWAEGDRESCANAVEVAFARSPAKTSLFFALVLRRQGRPEASVRWLQHYLLAQDPMALGREFQIILECVSQGAFGPAGQLLLRETLEEWRRRLLDDEQVRAAQVARWRGEIDGLRGGPAQAEFPRLAAVCPQWEQLDRALRAARGHRALLDRFGPMAAAGSRPSDRLEDMVDDILDQLVNDSDSEELPLVRELLRLEAVIRHEGDKDAAQRETDLRAAAMEEVRDYLTIQSSAALDPAAVGASPAAQRLAVASCHEWFGQAHASYSRDYRAAVPADIEVQISNTTGVGNGRSKFRMTRWKKSLGGDLRELEQSLNEHWNTYARMYVESLEPHAQNQVLGLVGTSVVVLLVFIGLSVAFAVVAALVVAGGWGLHIHNRVQTARKAQAEARRLLARHQQEAVLQLRGAHAELTDWWGKYRAADAEEPKAREFIASLGTATGAPTPYEIRVVDAAGAGSGQREEA